MPLILALAACRVATNPEPGFCETWQSGGLPSFPVHFVNPLDSKLGPTQAVSDCTDDDTGWPCSHLRDLESSFSQEQVCEDGKCVRFTHGGVTTQEQLSDPSCAELLRLANLDKDDPLLPSTLGLLTSQLSAAVQACLDLPQDNNQLLVFLFDNPYGSSNTSFALNIGRCASTVFVDVNRLPRNNDDGAFYAAVNAHELGHVFSLDHVCEPTREPEDSSNIMQSHAGACCCECLDPTTASGEVLATCLDCSSFAADDGCVGGIEWNQCAPSLPLGCSSMLSVGKRNEEFSNDTHADRNPKVDVGQVSAMVQKADELLSCWCNDEEVEKPTAQEQELPATILDAGVGVLNHDEFGSYLGYSLAAGDLTGDGVTDLLVGAPGIDEGGEAWLLGGPIENGLLTAGIRGAGTSDALFGIALATGDLNGDQVLDAVIADRGSDDVAGLVSLLFGPVTDLSADVVAKGTAAEDFGSQLAMARGRVFVGARRAEGNRGSITVLGVDGKQQAQILGTSDDGLVGTIVANVGDITGDGLDEVAVGLPTQDVVVIFTEPLAGTVGTKDASVLLVGEEGHHAGMRVQGGLDADGDGAPDLVVSGHNRAPVTLWTGAQGGELVKGPAHVDVDEPVALGSLVGDRNGDGLAELALGVPEAEDKRGALLLFSSPLEGTVSKGESQRWVGTPYARLGHPVVEGDFNNDGTLDLAVSAIGARGIGAAYVLF